MTTISATSILASRHAQSGKRIDTLLLRYPRCVHSEFMTHRVFSRNAASSRAIPVNKLIKDVMDDPYVPLVWGKNQKGMQADEECNEPIKFRNDVVSNEVAWLRARDTAVDAALRFDKAGYHKQIINRLLEPFAHITVVITATEFANFFALRDHKDAEPHIAMLARAMKKAMAEAEVQVLQPGQWHLPFTGSQDNTTGEAADVSLREGGFLDKLRKLSVARCASTSYKTVEGFDMTLERAIALHDKLLVSDPLHASPAEHQAQADEWMPCGSFSGGFWRFPKQHGNFQGGFRQYRKMLDGENIPG